MSKEIEIEFKSMLTQNDYEELLHYYDVTDDQFVIQTNLYFDTADFQLKQQGMGLRIRRFADRAEATLKVPQTVGLLEITDDLSLNEADLAVSKEQFAPQAVEILGQIQKLNIELLGLTVIGKLITKRAEFTIPEGKLALDESWYSDQHDYELELEVPDSSFAEADFSRFLNKFELPYRKTQNKIARAVGAQQGKNKETEGPQ